MYEISAHQGCIRENVDLGEGLEGATENINIGRKGEHTRIPLIILS